MNKEWINNALNCEEYFSFKDFFPDHWIVRAKIRLTLRRNALQTTRTTHYDWSRLNNRYIRNKYTITLKNKFDELLWQYSLGPQVSSTSSNHFDILGRWSSNGPDRGIAHFFTATINTIEGVGENEQNEQYEPGVNSKCKTRSYVTLCIPVSIYRLTLAWISSENSTTHEECWLILTRLPSLLWTSSPPTGLSAVRCRLPCPSSVANCLLLTPFVSPPDLRSRPTSGHVEISSPNPLSGFVPKQTKKSTAWRTSYIVLHFIRYQKHRLRMMNTRTSSMSTWKWLQNEYQPN